uniref:Uncharacterized protein n=1 Tax=mine drainage metagenome TaxID=410659 RepID=E6Q5G6_9ZZZZ
MGYLFAHVARSSAGRARSPPPGAGQDPPLQAAAAKSGRARAPLCCNQELCAELCAKGPNRSPGKTRTPSNARFDGVFHGSGCWTRTNDPLINSQLLYQLS